MCDARSNTPNPVSLGLRKMRIRLSSLKPFFILLLTLSFIFNSIGGDLLFCKAWAASGAAGLTSVGSEGSGGPTPLKNLSPETFNLPQELGYIQESVKVPDSKRTVIHIQDAHCNYAAQRSIVEILAYLTTEYGVYAVNCEGGAEGYDLSVFTNIQGKSVREKTADYFVKEGVVSAAEYYAVNNPQKVKLWGVEDPDLYIKNLKIYKDSLAHKSEVDRYIKSLRYILDNLKRHIYSNKLLEFDKYYTRYKENKIAFKEYLLYLISIAQKRMINVKSFPNIYILSRTLQEEDKIDFRKANNEKDEVVDKLKKILSRNELKELMVKVGELKIERISQADFYVYLSKKAKSIKLDLTGYSELQKYIIYISLYSAVDRTKVAAEIDALEDKIKESMYENDAQRELGILSKDLTLTRNIFNISLTKDDYLYYMEHREAFAVSHYISFIDKKAPLYKISAKLDRNIGLLDEYRESMDQFYACSLERDKAFIKNIKFTDHDRPNSIIITGGFHTENLRELFNKEKVSYISIMPKFSSEKGYESPYMKRLTGQRTALENVIDTAIPAVLSLQVVEILSTRLALQVEGEANLAKFRLAVAIMAAIIQGKEFILKINAGIPIAGIDDEGEKFITFSEPKGSGAINHSMTSASQMTSAARDQFDAVLTGMTPNTFVFNIAPLREPAAAAPAPVSGEPSPGIYAGPVIQPAGAIGPGAETWQGPIFIGTLRGRDGTTNGFAYRYSADGKNISVIPPYSDSVPVSIVTDRDGNEMTVNPALLSDRLSKLTSLTAEQRPVISQLAEQLPLVKEVVMLEPQEAVQGFIIGQTLYLSRALIDRPAEIGLTGAVTADARFAQDIQRLSGDLRQGVLNIFLIKTTPQTIAGQTAVGHEARNIFEKKFGIDTIILYYTDAKGQRAQLERMSQLLLLDANKGKYPMAFANCMNQQELKTAQTFISRNDAVKDMVAIGRDFGRGKNRIPEEIKVMFVGSTMMNDRRLSKTFNMSAEALFESRKNILRAFELNNIINVDDINKIFGVDITGIDDLTEAQAELVDRIMNNIWGGILLLNCSKIDWKTFDDWKNSQRQLLQSV